MGVGVLSPQSLGIAGYYCLDGYHGACDLLSWWVGDFPLRRFGRYSLSLEGANVAGAIASVVINSESIRILP